MEFSAITEDVFASLDDNQHNDVKMKYKPPITTTATMTYTDSSYGSTWDSGVILDRDTVVQMAEFQVNVLIQGEDSTACFDYRQNVISI